MTIQQFENDLKSIESVVQQGLATTDAMAKTYGATTVEVPVEAAEMILPVIEDLVNKALAAWSNASGTPITVETVTDLLPNQTPLTPPPAGS